MDPQQNIPQANEFPPVPASPAGVPGIPPTAADTAPGQDEMKARLAEVMANLEGKYQQFDASKFGTDNKMAQMKSDAMSELFTMLESKGIDPNNPEELKAFLDKIKEGNPELYQQVVSALNAIIGTEEQMNPNVGEQPDPNAIESSPMTNNMNINNANGQPEQNI
jgi:hypothetical protein